MSCCAITARTTLFISSILTAPDGRSYSVAVMIKKTSVPLPTRMTLMNDVVRAVIAQHDMEYAAAAR